MYEFEFYDVAPLFNSPYNTACIRVKGGHFPNSSEEWHFQDKAIVSADEKTLYLVLWDPGEGQVAFKVLKFSDADKTVSASKRLVGCCNKLELTSKNEIQVSVYRSREEVVEVITEFPTLING